VEWLVHQYLSSLISDRQMSQAAKPEYSERRGKRSRAFRAPVLIAFLSGAKQVLDIGKLPLAGTRSSFGRNHIRDYTT